MKIARLPALLGIVLASCTLTVSATPILITELDLGAFAPYGDAHVGTEIGEAITAYNLAHTPDLPTTGIGSVPNVKVNTGDSAPSPFPTFAANTLSITITGGYYNYLFLHWGGPDTDIQYKNPQLYYIGGDLGALTFNAPSNFIPNRDPKQYGLSFYSLYSPIEQVPPPSVPDGGATVALLGMGLTALEGLRRRFKASV